LRKNILVLSSFCAKSNEVGPENTLTTEGVMQIIDVSQRDQMISLHWADGDISRYPAMWLRDNEPGGFHVETKERIFDLLSVDETITPQDIRLGNDGWNLIVRWPDLQGSCSYKAEWLKSHAPGKSRADASKLSPVTWNSRDGAIVHCHNAEEISTSKRAMLAFLEDVAVHGLALVEGLPDREDAGLEIGNLIGPRRNSNFGAIFDVISKPDANNLAYTAVHLHLHTDLPNQEIPPGWQFLHCIVNEAEGGDSLYCDGFQIARDLRETDPAGFDLLASTPLPFRFHDKRSDLHSRHPVVTLDQEGNISMIAWNAHLAEAFDMAPETVAAYYSTYRTFMRMTRDPAYVISLRMAAGEMAIFDNRRVLHGRSEFFPNTGDRHLKGYYIDRIDVLSQIRLLNTIREN
jgi:gamma-butyrobetaine dioxygenase